MGAGSMIYVTGMVCGSASYDAVADIIAGSNPRVDGGISPRGPQARALISSERPAYPAFSNIYITLGKRVWENKYILYAPGEQIYWEKKLDSLCGFQPEVFCMFWNSIDMLHSRQGEIQTDGGRSWG